jgi:hypothetical protein
MKNFKKKFGDFDQRKNTLKILPEDMIRNTNNWAAETKSFESSVQLIFQKSYKWFCFKMSKKLILLKPLNEFVNRALSTDEL